MYFPPEAGKHYATELIINILITPKQLKELTNDDIDDIIIELHCNGYINKDNDKNYITWEQLKSKMRKEDIKWN